MLNADYSASPPETLTVAADSDLIKVPDAHLLFNAQYSRTAHDLILTDTDGSRLVISGYFDRPELPSLASPEGAMLGPEVITALAGPLAPSQYAQAGGAGGGEAIGKVTALTGTVTAQHTDGTVVQLQIGDAVFQGDVLQSGTQSSIGVVFADDTVFSLSASARMVLNEMVYQPGGSDNSMTFSLVEGSFSFIAGKVAPTGEMKFNTPVASMGIRGTCGGAGTSANGNTQFVLCEDPDGKVGAYVLTNLITGELLATVNTTSFAFVLSTPTGEVVSIPRSEADQISDETIQTIYQVYDNAVKSGDIQGSNETGGTTVGEKAPPTPEQVLTVGETAFSAGNGNLGDGALPKMTDLGTENLTGEEDGATEQDGDSTSADSAVGSTTQAAASAEPEPVIVSEPNPTRDPDPKPEMPSPNPPVTGTATEGGSSSTLSASPNGGTVSGVDVDNLPAGVIYFGSTQEFRLDPAHPAYDSLAAGEPRIVRVDYLVNNAPAAVQWTVTGTNDAPAGSDNTIATNENTARALTASDFGFGDPSDNQADALAAVIITTTPAAGALTFNGAAVSAGQSVSVADINAGLLVFTPATNASGTGYASFTFQVQDDGGTANGGQDTDPSANTIVINVAALNHAPAGTDNTITTNEDTARTLTVADFGFSDSSDSPAHAFAAVTITTIPVAGTLTLNGGTVTAGQSVSVADINAGLLVFTPAANANGTGYASFTFQVQDNGGTANGGQDTDPSANTITIDVAAVNDAPAGTSNTITTNEDTARTFTAADFGFTDPNDTPANSLAAVTITTAPASGALTLNGVAVTAGQSVSVADINAGLLVFTPAGNANGTGYASFTFQVQDNGGVANGGQDTDPSANTITINVTSVNDAPTGTDNTITATEDTARTLTAADFGFTDLNDSPANSLAAVTITTIPAAGDLTLNGVAVSAGQSVSIADINAGLLVFTPDANASGPNYASFTFQVQDNGGVANGGQDTDQSANTITIDVTGLNHAPAGTDNTITTNEDTAHTFTAADFGFTDPNDSPANALSAVTITTTPASGALTLNGVAVTAGQSVSVTDINAGLLVFTPDANANGAGYASFTFQVEDDGGIANGGEDIDPSANTITIDVTSVNDAPAGASNTITTNEDTARTLTAADFGFTDPNDSPADALAAVTITTTPGSGALTLSGVAVTAGQSVSVADINAGLLVFTPDANANGAGYTSFNFQVQDDGGTANGGQDTDQSADTITVDVTSVNDAPEGTDVTLTTNEDTALTITAGDFGFSDQADQGDALSAVTITTTPASGALTLNGVAVTAGQSVSIADINAGLLVFTPTAEANGAGYASFTFQVEDDGGTANSGEDTDPTANTITIDVTAVNDAPAGTDNTITTNEDTAHTFTTADFGFSDPNDSPADALAAVIITAPPASGTLTLDGFAVTSGQSVSIADINNGLLVFTPDANAYGTGYASLSFQVQDDGGTANGGQDTDQSANTITIDVTAVNDAPVAFDDGPLSVDEDATLSNIDVLGNDTDIDGDTLSISGKPTALHLTVPATALPSNLIARWTADGTAEDAVGGNDGVLQNGASFTSGNFGQAFHFDGIDDSVAAPTTGLPVGNSDRTISLWMKADSFGSGETFLAGYGNFGSSGQTYQLGTSGDTLFFSQWGSAVFGPSLEAGEWYHVAVTNVGNSVTLYVDGVAVATGTVSINTPAGTDFLVGARPTISVPGLLQGDVDDIQVYDRALTAQEIESVYNAGAATAEHGTVTVNPDGTLNYTPDPDFSGTDTITYVVTDGTSTDTGQVTITVNAVNDAPVINNLNASTTSLEGVADVIDPDVTISDAELDASNYGGSTLTVARTASPDPEDTFSFGSSTNFSVDGSTLKDNSGKVIANFSTAGNSLVISFTAFATAALVDDVAQHIAYANTSDTPPASIVLDYTISDGELSDTESITVNITAVNDGPFAVSDNVITNIAPGNPIVIPERALLANDTDADGGGPLDVNFAGGAVDGTVTHDPGSGATGTVTFTGNTLAGGAFIYDATDGGIFGGIGVANVSFDMDGALEGTAGGDILIGANGGTMLIGHGGADRLVGGIGRDTYVWSANDGYDTILPNGTGANEDIIKIRGSFYDYNWDLSGDDLIVGVVADDTYQWPGGNLTIKDFLIGGDSVEYLTADLGDNNGFYSPGGGDARIYLSAVTGTDQGNYFETIIGTDDGETMVGNGGAIDWFNARGGNDTMSVSNGTQGFFRAGDGDDFMTGADEDDQFIGGDGEDTIFGNGGIDEVRYDRAAGSLTPMPDGVGVTVNIGTALTLSTGGPQIDGGEAIDNWGKTDELTGIENVRGSDFNDTIVGSDADNQLRGLRGDDILVGRAGADVYRWSLNDGYDTILADEGSPDEDVIRLDGSLYDFNWELDGNDLVVGAAVDASGDWSDVGGNLRLKDFVLPGGDTIDYLTADLGPDNNEFYSPDGGGMDARLYLSAVNGNDQGSFTELIVGTDAGETMMGGGGAADRLMGGGGNDIMSVSAGTRGHFTGGDGDDEMTGGDLNDVFRGGDGADTIIGGGGSGDEVRYDSRADSTALPTQGVTVNLGGAITIAGVNGGSEIAGTTGIDNWGKTDTLSSIERVRGSTMSDLLVGSNGGNRIQGMGGDDTLIGRGGADTYVWGANDGYDTILSNGGAANEDIIQIAGSFYDLNWEKDGNDLIVGAAADDSYVWADVGGNLRIKNFFTGTDTISYLTGNVGANNEFYSPGGGEDARIYLSAVNGGNQGNYFEAIVGTSVGEVMTGGGGAIDHLSGGGGNDTMSVDANTFGIFRGGDGDDDMTGGDMEDNFVGGAGNDTFTGGNGADEVRYDRPGGSNEGGMTQGVLVNLGTTITIDIDGVPTLFQGFTAQDNWGDQDEFTDIDDLHADIEDVRGSALADDLVGSDLGNQIRGMAGDDVLVGRGGGDTYVWSFNDGHDTILSDEGAANEDVIRLNGSFYDFNWEGDPDKPNDLIVGGAVNDVYDWNDVGGNLRIKDFFLPGNDTIAYIEGDFGPNNSYFNPDGSDGPTQIYLNAVTGEDQGNHSELILGTYGNDTMVGNGGAFDIFYGDAGDDIMSVDNGTRAHFRGGDGNDTMTGADQDDDLRGAAGDDILDGGDGFDTAQYDRRSGSVPFTHGAFVNLSAASATMMFNTISTTVAAAHAYDNWGNTDSLSNIENVRGSDYDDIVLGSADNNFINVAGGADKVWAGAGDDEVLGGDGNDELHGELGENDILQGYAGDDLIDGGLGAADAADYYDDPNGVIVNLATGIAKDGYGGTDVLQDIEQIYASFYDDLLTGNSQDNWIEARDGDDIVFGGAGNDALIGGNGDDELHGEADDDTLEGGAGNDFLDGGQGHDYLYGGENDDTLSGGAGNDELYGEDNDDTLEGGAGDDTIFGGDGIDTLSYEHSPFGVYVNPNISEAHDGYGGVDLIGGDIENYRGSAHADILYGIEGMGPSASNVIEGGAGDDYINGDEFTNYAGDMVSYLHDPAGVTVDLSAGTATDGYGDTDEIVNIEGILGSAYNDTLTGTGVGNRIEAGSGYDTINMPTLEDTYIDGGRGQDILALNDEFATIDLTAPDFVLTGVETIDLTGTGNNFLILSGANVADISDDSNLEFTSDFADNLVVKGDSGDQVTLFSDSVVGWTPGATNTALDGSGPGEYNIYNYTEGSVTASLAVDHDVAVIIAPV